MALFNKKEEKEEKDLKDETKKVVKAKSKKAEPISVRNSEFAYNVLIEPWITEKSHSAISSNKYFFKVSKRATKGEVKKAVEGTYNVKVEKIAIVNTQSRVKNFGRNTGIKAGFKKAILTLKEGSSIELFKGA
ncbi:MAG: 50S ribosomal protein L23 [uncultured bacterium]|nr:MAG: 50S ribosomal protein L23 [uncultured bacterium]HBR71860.1 50S ribosomal protein L23 [Candidatus Moranbacteria bacterium]